MYQDWWSCVPQSKMSLYSSMVACMILKLCNSVVSIPLQSSHLFNGQIANFSLKKPRVRTRTHKIIVCFISWFGSNLILHKYYYGFIFYAPKYLTNYILRCVSICSMFVCLSISVFYENCLASFFSLLIHQDWWSCSPQYR